MSVIDCERNASPPTDNYDFDTGRVTVHKVHLTALGAPCQYINILDEDAFLTPSDSDETELSSEESISFKDTSARSITIPPISSSAQKIKEEKLSDSEDLKIVKSIRRTPPKKYPVVEYSDSDASEEDAQKSRRSKVRHRRHSGGSDESRSEGRLKSHHKKHSDRDRYKSRHRKYSDDSDGDYYRSSSSKEYSRRAIKKEEEEEEREFKYMPGVTAAFGSYHCQVCDIVVNSEITYQTHLQGKKHQKNLKAKAVPDVVSQSLNESWKPVRVPPPPIIPIKKAKRVRVNAESLIQRIAEDYKDGPLPFLSEVVEIRPPVEGVKDVSYICNLCNAQCVPNSIMKHLTGSKHYLHCLEKIDEPFYKRVSYIPKKQFEEEMKRILLRYEKYHGRGRIKVESEVAEECSQRDEPGPSWRTDAPLPPLPSNAEDDDIQFVSAVEHLDTSMSDFYCRACDAHMNNQAMWESHVRGKRHLKNIKKIPGESTSKIKSVQVTGETAQLMRMLEDLDEKDQYGNDIVIVGLGYIKETQGEGGNLYNCYLCGACTSSYDIIDHLNQPKHKIKFLEEMNAKGCKNGIDQIKALSGFSAYAKESMVNDECRKTLEKYGDGKVAVYRSKTMFTPSYP